MISDCQISVALPGMRELILNAFRAFVNLRRNPKYDASRCLKLAALIALLASAAANAQMLTRPLSHNGYMRPYLTYRPAHLPLRPAVVFMLGGITSTAQSTSQEFGWARTADENGFVVVFPDPLRTDLTRPPEGSKNITFWEMQGSRTHILGPGMKPVDDDGYLMAVLMDVMREDHPDRNRIFFAGFSSGSGMAQLFASRHPDEVRGVVAVATPLMEPPMKLRRPVPILYIHGDEDEQFTAFEANSPHFVTTPHGNWVTWGYLDGCQKQTAEKTAWGIQMSWRGCRDDVPVIGDLVAGVGHEWEGSASAKHDEKHPPSVALDFTAMAWEFFASLHHTR